MATDEVRAIHTHTVKHTHATDEVRAIHTVKHTHGYGRG